MKRVIEITSAAITQEEAQQCLDQGQRIMIGFLGGRILPPSSKHSTFVVQTFHEDCDLDAPMNGWLPDGMRRCYLPSAVASQCGINQLEDEPYCDSEDAMCVCGHRIEDHPLQADDESEGICQECSCRKFQEVATCARRPITREQLIDILEESLSRHKIKMGQKLSRTDLEPIIASFIFAVAREECIQNG